MNQPQRSLSDLFTVVLSTGCGLGLSPKAPGTFGSLGGIALAYGLQQLPFPWGQLLVPLIFLAGIPLCERAGKIFGKLDPGQVVFDEIVAIPVMYLYVPIVVDVKTAILGFLWFRLFDIWKPWPIRTIEKLHGGLGVMADDIGAALYATAALYLTLKIM